MMAYPETSLWHRILRTLGRYDETLKTPETTWLAERVAALEREIAERDRARATPITPRHDHP
jgi:hypothetical protein